MILRRPWRALSAALRALRPGAPLRGGELGMRTAADGSVLPVFGLPAGMAFCSGPSLVRRPGSVELLGDSASTSA